jgi:hypothetical protein
VLQTKESKVSCAGDVVWQGSSLLDSATQERAQLTACVLGLRAAAGLGLASTTQLQLQCTDAAPLRKVSV